MTPLTVLALDSAEKTGYAILKKEEGTTSLIRSGTVIIRLDTHAFADVESALLDLLTSNPDIVVVEEPFISPKNPHTGLVLARLLGRWLQALETRGHNTMTIPAVMWQVKMLPGVTNRTKSADRKIAALKLVKDLYNIDATEDEADAIVLGLFVAETARRKGEPGPASEPEPSKTTKPKSSQSSFSF